MCLLECRRGLTEEGIVGTERRRSNRLRTSCLAANQRLAQRVLLSHGKLGNQRYAESAPKRHQECRQLGYRRKNRLLG